MEVCGGRVGPDFFEENRRCFAASILVNRDGSMCKLYLVSLEEFDGDWGLTGFVAGSMGRAFNPLVSGALYLGWYVVGPLARRGTIACRRRGPG